MNDLDKVFEKLLQADADLRQQFINDPARETVLQELLVEKQEAQFIIDGTNVGTWQWNIQSGETRFNKSWAEMIGYTLEELQPTTIQTWINLAHPEDLEKSNLALNACFDGKAEFYDVECRMRHKNGDWVWVLDRGKIFTWTADGKPLMMYGTHTNITEQKQREEQLRRSELAFSNTFHFAGVGMALIGIDGSWLKVNRKLSAILGYSQTELLQTTFQKITFPEDLEKDLRLFDEVIEGKRNSYQVEKRYIHKNGSVVFTLLNVAVIRDKDGNAESFISQITDITELRFAQDHIKELLDESEKQNKLLKDTQAKLEAANANLLEQSIKDPLTELGNRRVLNTCLQKEMSRITRMRDGDLSIIILDVDLFKHYNDSFGHPEGDKVLKMLADRLKSTSRVYDVVTRFGGEEFAIVLPDTNSKTAMEVAERLRSSVVENTWPNSQITISVGVCTWIEGMTSDELIKFADNALYRAKRNGRNCTMSWKPKDYSSNDESLSA